MRSAIATQRYLERHIYPGLPGLDSTAVRWQQVLVVPTFAESPDFLQTLRQLPVHRGRCLLIVVLNRPDSEHDTTRNHALRQALSALPAEFDGHASIQQLSQQIDVYLYDLEADSGPLPAREGVGLARKIGCDLAVKWIEQGCIDSQWICCADADAILPADYFSRLAHISDDSAAALFPFSHRPAGDAEVDLATALYELRMHHYVLGLQHAKSPYAFHTLGSCLAINADAYMQCRGFPKRAGGEDFYLLNKLAKVGAIARLKGQCIRIASRRSDRAPFGTGPAIERLLSESGPCTDSAHFYHPAGFEALRCLLLALPSLHGSRTTPLATLMEEVGLNTWLASATQEALQQLGFPEALRHCMKQARDEQQFLKQMHVWLDAFRTLRLMHLLRDAGLTPRSLVDLMEDAPQLWPTPSTNVAQLRDGVNAGWGWLI